MQKVRRILAIDGGGTRGLIPATILAAIEERTGEPISQLFDLIAGTSTGGILALALTKANPQGQPEFKASSLCELYEKEIPRIFQNPQTWWGNLLSPKYRSFSFQASLKDSFEDCRLKNALTDVLIPCYDIEHRLPYMFKSSEAKLNIDSDFPIKDVALAACASPTLFHPVRIPRTRAGRVIHLVDGGVFANNPSLSALSELKAVSTREDEKYFVVSIGTGKSTRPLSDELVSLWGYVQWSRPMLELVMESISESVHQQMMHILPTTDEQQYYRFQVDLPDHTDPAIDNSSPANMEALLTAAKDFCQDRQNSDELDRVCAKLLELREPSSELQPSAH